MYLLKVREYNAESEEKGMACELYQRTLFIFGKFSNNKKNTKIPHKTGFLKRQKFYKTQNLLCYHKNIFSNENERTI